MIILAIKKRITFFNKHLGIVLFIYFIYSLLVCFKYKSIYISPARFYDIFFAFMLINIYKDKLFHIFEKVCLHLSIISLFIYLFALIIPGFIQLFKAISFPTAPGGTCYATLIFTGISRISEAGILPIRNLGFAWEPGRFSAIIIIAIYFNLIRTHFRLRNNTNLLILIITLISAQSTTGYMALFLCCFSIYLYNQRKKYFLFAIITGFSICLCLFIFVPFLKDKILLLANIEEQIKSSLNLYNWYLTSNNGAFVPQRFEALFYSILDFINDPLLGHGKDMTYSYTSTHIFQDLSVSLSNSTIQIFAENGIFIGLLFYYILYKTSKAICYKYRYKGTWFYFILFIVISISYQFHQEPLIIAFIFYSYFYCNEKKRNNSPTYILCKATRC